MTILLIKKYLFLVALASLLSVGFGSCRSAEPLENKTKLTTEEKAVFSMEKKEDDKARAEYDKAVKMHHKNQARNTRMMMKDAKKKQRKNNRVHQRSLWVRLFGNHCNK